MQAIERPQLGQSNVEDAKLRPIGLSCSILCLQLPTARSHLLPRQARALPLIEAVLGAIMDIEKHTGHPDVSVRTEGL